MIALSVYERLEVPKSEASGWLNFVLEKMKETLAKGEDVPHLGFRKVLCQEEGKEKGEEPCHR